MNPCARKKGPFTPARKEKLKNQYLHEYLSMFGQRPGHPEEGLVVSRRTPGGGHPELICSPLLVHLTVWFRVFSRAGAGMGIYRMYNV